MSIQPSFISCEKVQSSKERGWQSIGKVEGFKEERFIKVKEDMEKLQVTILKEME